MKKVLIITYYFPPRPAIASVRLGGLAKYLPEFGWEPVILTASLPGTPDKQFQVVQTFYPGDVTARLKKKIYLHPDKGFQEQIRVPLAMREGKRSITSKISALVRGVIAYPDERIHATCSSHGALDNSPGSPGTGASQPLDRAPTLFRGFFAGGGCVTGIACWNCGSQRWPGVGQRHRRARFSCPQHLHGLSRCGHQRGAEPLMDSALWDCKCSLGLDGLVYGFVPRCSLLLLPAFRQPVDQDSASPAGRLGAIFSRSQGPLPVDLGQGENGIEDGIMRRWGLG